MGEREGEEKRRERNSLSLLSSRYLRGFFLRGTKSTFSFSSSIGDFYWRFLSSHISFIFFKSETLKLFAALALMLREPTPK
jgi:hypothetical protein